MRELRVPRSTFPDPEPRGHAAVVVILFAVVGLVAGSYWFLGQRLSAVAPTVGQLPIAIKTTRAPVLSSPTPSPVPMRLKKLDWDLPDGHFYTQTNGRPPGESALGFPVLNSNYVYFYNEWLRLGGIDTLGYPLSSRFFWHGKMTQVFQRGVMQWNDRAGELELVNVFADLHDLGKDPWLFQQHGVPLPLSPTFDTGKTWEAVVGDRMRLLDVNPKIKEYYLAEKHRLLLYGLPDSMALDQGNRIAIRFQRTVMYYWTQPGPGVKPGEVTVADTGAIAIEAGLFPSDLLTLVAPAVGTAPMEPVEATPTAATAGGRGAGVGGQGAAAAATTPVPVVTPVPTAATVAPTAAQRSQRVGNTNGDGVFLRRTPRLEDRLRPWSDGTVMEILGETTFGDGLPWSKVKDPSGNVGWVPSQFLVH